MPCLAEPGRGGGVSIETGPPEVTSEGLPSAWVSPPFTSIFGFPETPLPPGTRDPGWVGASRTPPLRLKKKPGALGAGAGSDGLRREDGPGVRPPGPTPGRRHRRHDGRGLAGARGSIVSLKGRQPSSPWGKQRPNPTPESWPPYLYRQMCLVGSWPPPLYLPKWLYCHCLPGKLATPSPLTGLAAANLPGGYFLLSVPWSPENPPPPPPWRGG